MKNYMLEELKAQFEKLNYKWFDFQIIAIRSELDIPNKFDDFLIVVNKNKLTYFTCTTNPGTPWLRKLLNPKGSALLKPNQYVNSWKLGLHQGKYEALVQNKPITVYRDSNKNDKSEESLVTETGYFGINIHRASSSVISSLIGKYSAGCIVLNNPLEFKELLHQVKLSGLKEFTVTLLKEF